MMDPRPMLQRLKLSHACAAGCCWGPVRTLDRRRGQGSCRQTPPPSALRAHTRPDLHPATGASGQTYLLLAMLNAASMTRRASLEGNAPEPPRRAGTLSSALFAAVALANAVTAGTGLTHRAIAAAAAMEGRVLNDHALDPQRLCGRHIAWPLPRGAPTNEELFCR